MENLKVENHELENKNIYNQAKIWQIALFSLNMISTNMYLFLMGYVSYYACGIVGLAVVFVSTLATAMRMFDGFTDPIIGYLIDHTNGKFGKFRPFLVVGNIILATSMLLMYHTTHLMPSGFKTVYFVLIYALYIIGYTVQGTVTTSAQSCLTNDPKQRPLYGLFAGIFNIFLFTGASVLISNYLVPKYGDMNLAFFSELVNWVIIGSAICMIISYIAIRGKDKPEFFEQQSDTQIKVGFKEYWEVLKNNRALQMLVIAASTDKLAATVAGNSIVGVMIFGIICGNFEVMGQLSMWTMVPNIIILGLGIMCARKFGQKKALVVGTWLALIFQVGLFLVFFMGDPTQINLTNINGTGVIFLALYILLNGAKNISGQMVIPMMADCTDYEIYRSGYYVPGLIATVYSFIDKVISSLGATIVGVMVAMIGFKSSVPSINDPLTTGIFWVAMFLFCGMPILGWIASLISMKFYPLTGEKMEEIQRVIANKK